MGTTSIQPELSIIIVNWNCGEVILNCLESLQQTIKKHSYEIIVIDNNSTDKSPELIEKKYPQILLIKNNFNNYFSGGNNQGYNVSKGKNIFLLNPDIIAPEESVDRLLDFIKNNNRPAITVKLLNLDGTIQNTMYRSFPSAFTLFATGLSKLVPVLRSLPNVNKYLSLNRDFQKDFDVEQAPGAAILMKRELIKKLNYLLDEINFPLFYNDVDLSFRIKKLGEKILYKSDVSFYHIKQQSLDKLDFYDYSKNYCISSLKYFKKHKLYFDYLILKMAFFIRFGIIFLISLLHMIFNRISRIELERRKNIISKILKEEF
ncbi:MAG: glycosyltransferase family 2 protein [bacterium]